MNKTSKSKPSKVRNPIPDPQLNPDGLHKKYIISKTDGSNVDERAEYFVLRLDDHSKDPAHVQACRKAILTYATEIQAHLPKLADDIRARYSEMTRPGWPKRTPKRLANREPREVPGKAVIDEPKHEV